jgi:hypothetical protein
MLLDPVGLRQVGNQTVAQRANPVESRVECQVENQVGLDKRLSARLRLLQHQPNRSSPRA